MIPATRLHSEFLRRANRLNSQVGDKIEVYQIDSYLNESKDIYYENRLRILETNPEVRDELRKAEVKGYCGKCKQSKNVSQACIFEFPEDYYRLVRHTATIFCNDDRNCPEKTVTVTKAQSDDLGEILKDPFRKPSFEYEQVWSDEAADGLYVYHNDSFKVSKVCIDYYKRLPTIACPSLTKSGFYINADGNKVSVDSGYLLDTTDSWRKVVDIAVLIYLRDVSDVNDFQTQLNKILQVERLNIN